MIILDRLGRLSLPESLQTGCLYVSRHDSTAKRGGCNGYREPRAGQQRSSALGANSTGASQRIRAVAAGDAEGGEDGGGKLALADVIFTARVRLDSLLKWKRHLNGDGDALGASFEKALKRVAAQNGLTSCCVR